MIIVGNEMCAEIIVARKKDRKIFGAVFRLNRGE